MSRQRRTAQAATEASREQAAERLFLEAGDPNTLPARLAELTSPSRGLHPVRWAAMANPSLPSEVLIEALKKGFPFAWNNPAVALMLVEHGSLALEEGALRAGQDLGQWPETGTEQGRTHVRSVLQPWWSAQASLFPMVNYLEQRVAHRDLGHPERRQFLLLCCLIERLRCASLPSRRRSTASRQIERAEALALAKERIKAADLAWTKAKGLEVDGLAWVINGKAGSRCGMHILKCAFYAGVDARDVAALIRSAIPVCPV